MSYDKKNVRLAGETVTHLQESMNCSDQFPRWTSGLWARNSSDKREPVRVHASLRRKPRDKTINPSLRSTVTQYSQRAKGLLDGNVRNPRAPKSCDHPLPPQGFA